MPASEELHDASFDVLRIDVDAGTNVKCKPVDRVKSKDSAKYCCQHFVNPNAPVQMRKAKGVSIPLCEHNV